MTPPVLTDDLARFLQGAVSITAASRDRRRVPSVARVAACRVAEDRRHVTLIFPTLQATQLLADLAATHALAVVASAPRTHRTLQLKGSDAAATPLAAGDAALVAAHQQAFAEILMPLGYARELALGVHGVPEGKLSAVTFSVDAIFEQTPGPRAGVRVDK
jgi:hypothetical protein